jgi:membrane fusion protein, multidrug efflux system
MARRVLGGLTILLLVVGVVSSVPAWRSQVASWISSSPADRAANPRARRKRGLAPVPVRVAVASARKVPIHLEGVGTVKARSTVAIKSRIDGQLLDAPIREGQTVRKGDVLFHLDPRPLKARLKEAQANLARDRAKYAKGVADVKRLSRLSARGYTPKTQVEDAHTNVDTLAAAVSASEAELEIARLNLDYATIRSPIDGRLGRILVTPGNIVKANDTQALLIITQTKPIYVSFGVPEQYIDEVRRRMKVAELRVEVSTQGHTSPVAVGRLFFINNQVDTTSGTIELLASFSNKDGRLVPGQFVRARILLSTLEHAVMVPSRAIQINQTGQYVWVVRANRTAELRAVVTGPDSAGETVITKGLSPGERVVTDGQLRLFPGASVLIGGSTALGRKDGEPPRRGALNEAVRP